jgi:hypothetical protein
MAELAKARSNLPESRSMRELSAIIVQTPPLVEEEAPSQNT